MNDPEKTLNFVRETHKEDLLPDIEEDNIPTSETEYNMPVHVIPYDGESVRPTKNTDKPS